MDNKIMATLENLEEKIESIKWMLAAPFPFKEAEISTATNIIRKSSGILGRNFLKGTVYENKARRSWKANFLKRTG